MLLRRITKHVKDQNWTAVALDFVIVVIGVFIGLQAANWNNANTERLERERLLSELQLDLSADADEMADIIETATYRISVIDYLLDTASITDTFESNTLTLSYQGGEAQPGQSGAEIPEYQPDDETAFVQAVTFIRTFDGNEHTYQTLIHTGGLRLIKDRDLAREIQSYYANAMEVQDLENRVYDGRRTMTDALQALGLERERKISRQALAEIISANPQLRAGMQDWRYLSYNQRVAVQKLEARAQKLEKRLAAR